MTEQSNRQRVYTIGHSNVAIASIVALLRQHRIQVVVDVRSVPYSQYKPQFNREALERELDKAGLKYEFLGDKLGGHPTDPSCYKDGRLPPEGANFLKLVNYEEVARKDWYLAGIERLLEIARQRIVAVMCGEEDPSQCHRHHLIAQTLLNRAVEVYHIRKTGKAEPAVKVERAEQLNLF